MEKILIICGIWIAFLPRFRGNVNLDNKHKRNQIIVWMCIVTGCCSILVGLNAVLDFVKESKGLLIILYVLLLALSIFLMYVKVKEEKSVIAKLAVTISVILLLLSLYIVLADITEIASACVGLTGELIILASPCDAIMNKISKNNFAD